MLLISDDTLRALPISERELAQDIAVLLYIRGLPLGKAAAVAGLGRVEFRHALASRRVPVQYGVDDLERDVETLQALGT